eukprot:363504-Chlamydomonas_euryale.AAC.6
MRWFSTLGLGGPKCRHIAVLWLEISAHWGFVARKIATSGFWGPKHRRPCPSKPPRVWPQRHLLLPHPRSPLTTTATPTSTAPCHQVCFCTQALKLADPQALQQRHSQQGPATVLDTLTAITAARTPLQLPRYCHPHPCTPPQRHHQRVTLRAPAGGAQPVLLVSNHRHERVARGLEVAARMRRQLSSDAAAALRGMHAAARGRMGCAWGGGRNGAGSEL